MKARMRKIASIVKGKYKRNPVAQAVTLGIPVASPSIDRYLLTTETEKVFSSKEKYNEEVIKELEAEPKSLRAIVMGPYFLHPQWLINRRIKREDRRRFSLALRTYLEKAAKKPNTKVSMIIRPSPRYLNYLTEKSLVGHQDVRRLIHVMIRNLDRLSKSRQISFCCTEGGYYQNVIITEHSCFRYGRRCETGQIRRFSRVKDPDVIEQESNHFDEVFNENCKGKDEEIAKLKQFIMSLELQLEEKLEKS